MIKATDNDSYMILHALLYFDHVYLKYHVKLQTKLVGDLKQFWKMKWEQKYLYMIMISIKYSLRLA